MSTKKWVIGNFITGQVTEADILPTVGGSGKVTLNINSEDYATVNVSKRDLPNPAEWKTYLKPGYKLVALIDTSKAWNAEGAVLFAGFIKEVRATARETIALQIAGFREYASNRVVLSAQTGSIADPKASKTFTGSTWTNVLNNIANGIWDAAGLPSNAPKPPTATKGTVGSATGTGKEAVIENVNTMRFSDALDYVRDDLSDKGEEYRFVPRWQNSSKNRIVWDFIVGTAAAPQINFNQSFSVNLDGENYSIGLGNSLSLTDYATRIVGMSTQTEDATDLTLYNSGSNADLLIDDVFNPGVELTSAQLNTFTTERLNSQKLLQEEGELLVVSNADETWMTRVGASVSITGGAGIPEVSGMTFNMRLVEVSFSDSSTKVETRVMMNRARFGKLPNSPTSKNRFDNPSINTGVGGGGPITPKLPDNTPPIGGGGGGVQLPDFSNSPIFGSSPIITERTGSGNSWSGMKRYWRDKTAGKIYIAFGGNRSNYLRFGLSNTVHSDFDQCNDFMNTVAFPTETISIVVANELTPRNISSLFGFNFTDNIPQGFQAFGDFSQYSEGYMQHNLSPAYHTASIAYSIFTAGDYIYLWILGFKGVYRQSSNVMTDMLNSTGSKLFKNSISSGTSSTWEDTGYDHVSPISNTVLFPSRWNSMKVEGNKLKILNGLEVINSGDAGRTGKNHPFYPQKRITNATFGITPPARETDFNAWQSPLIFPKMWELDLTTGVSSVLGDIGLDDTYQDERYSETSSSSYYGTSVSYESIPQPGHFFIGEINGRDVICQMNYLPGQNPATQFTENSQFISKVGFLGNSSIAEAGPKSFYRDMSNRNFPAFLINDWIILAGNKNWNQGVANFLLRTKNSGGSWISSEESFSVFAASFSSFSTTLSRLTLAGASSLQVNSFSANSGDNIFCLFLDEDIYYSIGNKLYQASPEYVYTFNIPS